jgi:hypothetical protein
MNERLGWVALLTASLAIGCGGFAGKSNRALDPTNELPFGRIDTPVEGAQVASQVKIGGWALDDRGVREIRVYIDGHFADATRTNTDRPDVSKAYPQYARGGNLHGWTMTIAFQAPGPHTIIAQALDSDGATRDIGTLAVTSRDQ